MFTLSTPPHSFLTKESVLIPCKQKGENKLFFHITDWSVKTTALKHVFFCLSAQHVQQSTNTVGQGWPQYSDKVFLLYRRDVAGFNTGIIPAHLLRLRTRLLIVYSNAEDSLLNTKIMSFVHKKNKIKSNFHYIFKWPTLTFITTEHSWCQYYLRSSSIPSALLQQTFQVITT